jgi:hypothetical protein
MSPAERGPSNSAPSPLARKPLEQLLAEVGAKLDSDGQRQLWGELGTVLTQRGTEAASALLRERLNRLRAEAEAALLAAEKALPRY